MRLDYKILWFEDDDDTFSSFDRDLITRHLDALGFTATIIRKSGDEDDANIISAARKADLIVMDFGLADSHFGDQLIRQIRDLDIHTEVVFYSARGVTDLRELVYKKELDGVFCRPRVGIEEEILPIINSTLKKILDLENSRGLVMTELGELDLLMNRVIITVHDSSDERKAFIREKLKEKLDKQLEGMTEALSKFDETPIGEIVEQLDSFKRLSTMLSICKNLNLPDHRKQLQGYDAKVLFPRNCLGHGIPEETEDGYVFTHRGKPFIFNEKSSTTLRNDFRELRRALDALYEELTRVIGGVPAES